ncbi:MAG TPA: dihydrodipicolinate synthase family protein [Thermodesulfobacteriota bacterium]|nr:dihydrodipicolinate synthase family protein [Thermodesulfobacteriota bacterium]
MTISIPPPKGLIISLVTPLAEDGGIDLVSLRKLIERTLPSCDALMFGEGFVGEGLTLSNPSRRDLLRSAVDIVSGRKPLILFPTAATTEDTYGNIVEVARGAASLEGKGSLFFADIPLWHHSNRKLPQLYEEWAKETPFPFVLYNNPRLIAHLNRSMKSNNIRTAVLKRLAENEKIVGLVQTGDLRRTIHYQRAVRSRRDFRIYDGDELSFLNSPSSSGVVSGAASLCPAEWKETVSASLRMSEDPAANLLLLRQSGKMRDLSAVLKRNPAAGLKFALRRLGVISSSEVLEETRSAAGGESAGIDPFLDAHFSLQPPG